jgi:hypothetical protein
MQKLEKLERVNRTMSIQISKLRSILGANPIILVMKIVLVLIIIWMFNMFLPILDFNIVKLTRIEQLIESVRNILSYGLSQFLYYLMWGVYQGINQLFSLIGGMYYSPAITTGFANAICENMILRWFPGFTRTDDLGVVTPIPYNSYDIMDDVNILTSQFISLFSKYSYFNDYLLSSQCYSE